MFVLQIVGVAGLVMHRDLEAHVGQYVKSFDPDAHGGRGQLVTSPDRADALRFADAAEALAFYQSQSTVVPLRPDLKPNRPLTAFHVMVEPA